MKKIIICTTATREKVRVEFNCDIQSVIVHYRKGKYERSFDVFGTKLFPADDDAKKFLKEKLGKDVQILKEIAIGDTVEYKEFSTGDIIKVKIGEVYRTARFKRMGGSYYGNSVAESYVGDKIGKRNGVENISCESPVAKSLLGKFCGDEFILELSGNKKERCKIISVNKSKKLGR